MEKRYRNIIILIYQKKIYFGLLIYFVIKNLRKAIIWRKFIISNWLRKHYKKKLYFMLIINIRADKAKTEKYFKKKSYYW